MPRSAVDKMAEKYKGIFTTPLGREVLADLEATFGGMSYTKGDPYETAFKEGGRRVLLRIKHMLGERLIHTEQETTE